MTAAVETAKLAAEIAQGRLEFDIRAPYRGMISPKEAAAALGLVWRDVHGNEKRFATDFIFELLDSGELEGMSEPTPGKPVPYTRPDGSTGTRARKPRFTRVSRSSLMLYCARRWNMTSEQTAGILLDSARNLPVTAMRAVAAAIVKAADARESERKDRAERERMLNGR
jgi:hypothetical protein